MDCPAFSDTEKLDALPAVDWETGLERVRGNRKMLGDLLAYFFEGGGCAAAARAVCAGDLAAAAFEAHGVRGTASNLGLCRVAQCAQRLEIFLRQGDAASAAQAAAQLEELAEQARQEIAAHAL